MRVVGRMSLIRGNCFPEFSPVSTITIRSYVMLGRFIISALLFLSTSIVSAAEYSWDFRDGVFDNVSLVPLGPGAVNLLRPMDKGLRISVPAGHDVKSVGFSPRFTIRGDFEITVDFTLIQRTQPESGYGTGPTIYLSMGSTQDAAASLGRQLRTDGRDVYGVFAAQVLDGVRKPTAKLFDVPSAATAKTGRLRLRRTDEEITYSVADDHVAEFRPLATLPVSSDEVTLVRIGLSQSDPRSSGTILLHSVHIEADALPHLPSEQSRTAQLYRPRYQVPSHTSSRWIWQSLAATLVVAGFTLWWWKRQ